MSEFVQKLVTLNAIGLRLPLQNVRRHPLGGRRGQIPDGGPHDQKVVRPRAEQDGRRGRGLGHDARGRFG